MDCIVKHSQYVVKKSVMTVIVVPSIRMMVAEEKQNWEYS